MGDSHRHLCSQQDHLNHPHWRWRLTWIGLAICLGGFILEGWGPFDGRLVKVRGISKAVTLMNLDGRLL